MSSKKGTSEKQNVMGDLDLESVCHVVLSESIAQVSFW